MQKENWAIKILYYCIIIFHLRPHTPNIKILAYQYTKVFLLFDDEGTGHDHLSTTQIYLNLSPEMALNEFHDKW